MPMKDAVKKYYTNGIYHIYNRGVDKQPVFLKRQNYLTFMYLLNKYVSPKDAHYARRETKNYFGRIEILAFCLMENHFHLLIRQKDASAMPQFIKSVITSLTMRLNNQNARVGCLFQGVYKARLIKNKDDLKNISKYIHLNPEANPFQYPYSSVRSFIGNKEFKFINTRPVLELFYHSKKAYSNYLLAEIKNNGVSPGAGSHPGDPEE